MAARCRATSPPRVPVPPVTSSERAAGSAWVPDGHWIRVTSPVGRVRRRPYRIWPRTATSGSPLPSAAGSSAASCGAPSRAGRSTRRNRSGFSACADRSRPRTTAAAGSTTSSSVIASAPRVTTTNSASYKAGSASHCCTKRSAAAPARCAAPGRWRAASAGCGEVRGVGASLPANVASPVGGSAFSPSTSSPDRASAQTTTVRGAPASVCAAATSSGSPGKGRSCTPAASSPSASPWRSAPSSAHSPAGESPSGSSTHAWTNSESDNSSWVARSCSADTGRRTSDPTVTTGAPVVSAAASESPPCASWRSRTRSTEAPPACSATSVQANGMVTCPVSCAAAGWARNEACSAASSSAGCRPKAPACCAASSGSATSAKTSAPRRQAARSPWKAGP